MNAKVHRWGTITIAALTILATFLAQNGEALGISPETVVVIGNGIIAIGSIIRLATSE